MDKNLLKIMENYELEDVHEVITDLIPRGYNISSIKVEINELQNYPDKTMVTLFGFIDKFEVKAFGTRLKRISAKLYYNGQSVILYWISANQKYKKVLYSLEKNTPLQTLLQVTGKISSFDTPDGRRIIQIEQPQINILDKNNNINNLNKSVILPEPIYTLSKKTTLYQIKYAFEYILNHLQELKNNNFLPDDLANELSLKSLEKSLKYVHGFAPIQVDKINEFLNYPEFKRRLSLEKIWRILYSSVMEDKKIEQPSIDLNEKDIDLLKYLTGQLSFELTIDQKKTIWKILQLFSKKSATRSLIFGDVGSGKTLVSLFISYILVKKGYQVAIITPTSILARQHFEEALKYLTDIPVFLLHSKTKKSEKNKINNVLETSQGALVIGTTSVNSLKFSNLKLVFIDEEQKMGVNAKEKLYKEYNSHLIYMTATPIPRTLASAIFTNFEVFQIKSKPKNRKERITQVSYLNDQNELNLIKSKLKNEEQGLVIVPSISANDMVNVKSAKQKYKKLFQRFTIKEIHGKMKKEEVDIIIEEYMNGEFQILIATTMVDSGFSNKNLSFVFVEGAERFGISQLHQIRGRCGRGDKQGYCYLIPSKSNLKDITYQRLSFLTQTEDGFLLAEKDIELRGSGELDGEKQSGFELNFLDWVEEIKIMKQYLKNKENEC